jgi:GINS complex subunit 1
LRSYHTSIMEFRGEFEMDIDVTSSIENPIRELNVLVKVVKECGEIQTEGGVIDFKMGQRYQVRRMDIEHLIVQGYLEEV